QLEESLLRTDLQSQENWVGINTYHVSGTDYFFVLLGEPETTCQLLIWTGDKPEEFQKFDFLAKQLQCGCLWFRRLDKTQALLYRDDLTGLFNMRYLDVALESEIRRAQRFATTFSLLFI